MSEESQKQDLQDVSEDYSVLDIYRESRKHSGVLKSLLMTPIVTFVMGVAEHSGKERRRKKARVQQEERWRQEVRDE